MSDVLTILVICLVVLVIAMVAFVGVQRKRRAGGIVASRTGRTRRRL